MTQMGATVTSISSETEWVWRPGFGWVERPVVVETGDEEQGERETAAA